MHRYLLLIFLCSSNFFYEINNPSNSDFDFEFREKNNKIPNKLIDTAKSITPWHIAFISDIVSMQYVWCLMNICTSFLKIELNKFI